MSNWNVLIIILFIIFYIFQLVNDYLRDNYYSRLGLTNRDVRKLNTAACRLMLDIIPGLDIAAVFEMVRLFAWMFILGLDLYLYNILFRVVIKLLDLSLYFSWWLLKVRSFIASEKAKFLKQVIILVIVSWLLVKLPDMF